MTDFDYKRAAHDNGWQPWGRGWISNEKRRGKDGMLDNDYYEGSAKQLCMYIGVGPQWEEWKRKKYVGE